MAKSRTRSQEKAMFANMTIPKKVTFYDPRAKKKVDVGGDKITIRVTKNGRPMYVGETDGGYKVYQFAPSSK